MKVLKVIHGYPMRYNAGSEVYSQTLCHKLVDNGHEVAVFSRTEDPFQPDYELLKTSDSEKSEISLHLVNMARARDGYRHSGVDQRFEEVLQTFKPDIVHIGHLNHLSTSIPQVAKKHKIPVIYTLHDYWFMCPRGQFMQMFPDVKEQSNSDNTLWALCNGQDDRNCALRCYRRYFSGCEDEFEIDLTYWKQWVGRRMKHVREVCESVDLFIAPSKYLLNRYRDDFGLPEDKLVYLDYGFDHFRLKNRKRNPEKSFTFGYIGTHIPAKGIHLLLDAFGQLEGNPTLKIWGRPRGQETESLKSIATRLPKQAGERVQWKSEYRNTDIIKDVFNEVDAIVVPSIWVENSPLVIHEAQQARVPVITASTGGMAEYVAHEVNGLLVDHRSVTEMACQMQRLVEEPALATSLGKRGYLYSDDYNIPSIEEHCSEVEKLYKMVIQHG